MRRRSEVLHSIEDIDGLSQAELEARKNVISQFEFRVSKYYADLVDWNNLDDPLRRIFLPEPQEIQDDLDFDPSKERDNTAVQGLQHKYQNTALLLVTDICAAYCRFCFRKRFTLSTSSINQITSNKDGDTYEKETSFNVSKGLHYISEHPEIDNVLLTGGDPLMLSVTRLEEIIRSLRQLSHIKIIRIGTKVPAFDPERITTALLDMLDKYNYGDKRIYFMVHFNHPKELTLLAEKKIEQMIRKGFLLNNQTPLLRGVNDNSNILGELFTRLNNSGVVPYYLFQCRPTKGNSSFILSIQEGEAIVSDIRQNLNGLAKRFRYVGSHSTGKIEIVGKTNNNMIFRYHEAKNSIDNGKILIWPIEKTINWFDEVTKTNGFS